MSIFMKVRDNPQKSSLGSPFDGAKRHTLSMKMRSMSPSALERPERLSKVELDIVFLAFHADAYQDSALGVQVEPKVKKVAITPRVQTEVSSPNRVVLSNQGAVSDADHQP